MNAVYLQAVAMKRQSQEDGDVADDSPPITVQYRAFMDNMDAVVWLFRYAGLEMDEYTRRDIRAEKRAKTAIKIPTSDSQERIARRKLEGVNAALDKVLVLLEWAPVILVTAVEAYLQDVLASVAAVDTTLMARSNQTVSYLELTRAVSLQDVLEQGRLRWARNVLDNGGPSYWIKRLERMGARGYDKDTATRLERLIGTRHVVVHSAGIVTRDFVGRHGAVARFGERVPVTLALQSEWAAAAFDFAGTTDKFFVGRWPALGSPQRRPSALKTARTLEQLEHEFLEKKKRIK